MKVYKYIPPYNPRGKSNFRAANERTGVYLIKENSKIVYVGRSGYNLYKTMHRHFERWQHSQQKVISYQDRMKKHKYTVRIVYCTAKQAEALERALILKYKPRDNSIKYEMFTSPEEERYQKNVTEIYINTEIENELPF